MEQIQKFPIAVRTFWKCPTWFVLSTRCAAFPKKVWTPVAMTTASSSPCLQVEPENTSSYGFLVTGRDSPVSADWSIFNGSPSRRRASAGTISPSLILMISPGTSIAASCSLHRPSLKTCIQSYKL
ncbi:hypothetical protein Hanom_Chr12g01073121 [Helianthus anomalus]